MDEENEEGVLNLYLESFTESPSGGGVGKGEMTCKGQRKHCIRKGEKGEGI